MAEPTEMDRERAMEWYATEPPEVEACPTMFAGDAMAIYARALADERARLTPSTPETPGEARERRSAWAEAYAKACVGDPYCKACTYSDLVAAMEAEAAHQGKDVNDGK